MSDTPIPSTMVRAIGAMYKKFRNENKDEGKKNIMGSQRCINDSLDATAAMWIVDNLFFEEMPSMPNQKYVIAGIQFAIDSRVQIQEREKSQKTKETLNAWVEEQYPIFLRAEEKEFWCNVTKKIAIRDKQVEGTIASFTAEIETYRSNPEKAVKNYTAVKAAMESPRDEKLAKARIMYPFMDFLFKEQPLIKNMTTGQVTDLVAYHVASYEGLEQAK